MINGTRRTCNKKHNTLLHLNKQNTSNTDNSGESTTSNQNINVGDKMKDNTGNKINTTKVSLVNFEYNNTLALLSTAKVYIYDNCNNPILCRVLLDNGSQSCLLTTELWHSFATTNC